MKVQEQNQKAAATAAAAAAAPAAAAPAPKKEAPDKTAKLVRELLKGIMGLKDITNKQPNKE